MRTARGRVGLLSDEILRLDAQAEKLALLFCGSKNGTKGSLFISFYFVFLAWQNAYSKCHNFNNILMMGAFGFRLFSLSMVC